MAQATAATTAAERRAAALARARAQIAADRARDDNREIPDDDEPVRNELPGLHEPETFETTENVAPADQDPHGKAEALTGPPEPPVEEEPPEDDEDEDEPDEAEPPISHQALVTQKNARSRVQALLAEALRLGEAHHLIERRADGSFALPGQTRQQRSTSDCTCQGCSPHDQRHWWCVVCGSGAHDWLLVKPQYERQTLKPGGIEGARQAACSAQCARDFLARLGRQPSGVPVSSESDPTLALP